MTNPNKSPTNAVPICGLHTARARRPMFPNAPLLNAPLLNERHDERTPDMNIIQQYEAEQIASLAAARAVPEFSPG